MTNLKRTALAVVLGGAVLWAGVAAAAATPGQTCSSNKRKAVGKKAASKLTCHAKATTKGLGVDSTCLAKAEVKFSGTIAKADAKGGCATDGIAFGGDTAGLEAEVDSAVDTIQMALRPMNPTPLSKCSGNKIKAVGKKASSLLTCHAKAATKGAPVDSTCLAKAEVKFSSAFAKADAKGPDCQTTGDAEAVGAEANSLTNSVVPITPTSDGCGNNLVISPETCDDGNTEKFDFCDSDCIVDFCPGPTVTQQVTFTISNPNVAAVTLHVDYPESEIILPGTGTGAVATPVAGTAEVNDFDHALRLVVFDLFNFGTSNIATAQFETCSGGTPTPGEFTCTVVDAGDENLVAVPGVTCAVTIP